MPVRRLGVTLALVLPLVLGALPASAGLGDVNGRIVFERNRPPVTEIWTMNQDGSQQRRLGVGEDPDWSPDGTQIVFARERDLVFVRGDGSGERSVHISVEPAAYRLQQPDWSPDGTEVAFTIGGALYVVSAAGGSPRLLAATGDVAPKWSPDGSKIAFLAGAAVWVMNADGSGRRALPGARAGGHVAAWSRDGSTVAYGDLTGGISTVGLDGVEPVQVAPSAGIDPAWSPDGRRIAFVHATDICAVNADGSGLGRLTYAPVNWKHDILHSNRDPDWQPLPQGSVPAGPAAGRAGPNRSWNRSHAWTSSCTPEPAGRLLRARATPGRLRLGGVLTYRIHLKNEGLLPIGNGLEFSAWIDGGFRLLSVSATQGRCWWADDRDRDNPDAESGCSLGALFPGERATVTLRVRATTPGQLVLEAFLNRPDTEDEVIVVPGPPVPPDVQTRTPVLGCTRLGTQSADVLSGSRGADVLCGLDGDDRLRPGGGRDLISAGRGDDKVYSRDRRLDEVICGSGLDSVVADRFDRVGRHCERVVRR